MVSIFGLRFGGDRKKSPSKQPDKKPAPQQQQQQWNHTDQAQSGKGQIFAQELSRPERPPSRPGTSHSTTSRNTNWRTTFKDMKATSSMVDLSATMRRPSTGSLRQPTGEASGAKPWMKSNAGSVSLATPDSNAPRVGTPGRSTGAQKEWVNPLDVHFGKDPASAARPGTSSGANGTALKSPLGQIEVGIRREQDDEDADFGEPGPDVGIGGGGYPSPPRSIEGGEQRPPFSPNGFSSRKNTSDTLGTVEKFGPAPLPSPSPSGPSTNDERWEPPVIRDVQAKRDTLTFLSPRRRSFAMAIEEADRERHRLQQHPVEGFAGNFSDFDFGDSVAKPATPSVTPIFTNPVGTLGIELVQSPIQMTESNPFKEDEAGGKNRDMSDLSGTVDTKSPQQQHHQVPQQFQHSSRLSMEGPSGTTWPSPSRGAPIPTLKEAPRPGIQSPPAPVEVNQEPGTSPFGRAPPKGFNSRMISDARARGPPQPLRPAALSGLAPRVDSITHSPRSPYGPPATENSYIRTGEAPRPPLDRPPLDRPLPDRPLPERPLPSPFVSKTPLEGEFPVMKGLPRGRQPPHSPTEEQGGHSLPSWGGLGFDRSEPRHSAIPAPLTPAKRQPNSPTWTSTPTTATAPRIPSPTFPSLEIAISGTSEEFSKTFDISYDLPLPHPSPMLSEFSAFNPGSPSILGSPMRVEAKKAPPRPAPVTLPPLFQKDRSPLIPDGTNPSMRSNMEVHSDFI